MGDFVLGADTVLRIVVELVATIVAMMHRIPVAHLQLVPDSNLSGAPAYG
jgi:hypothetical protein